MTTKTLGIARPDTGADKGVIGITAALVAGLCLLFVAGVSQASVLHDAAHDRRHISAFPCH